VFELLKALLEESNLQPKDLASICQSESIVLDIQDAKRELTASQIKELAAFFHISLLPFLSKALKRVRSLFVL
jgi:HTH-type transcriptional regulator/antitoxin HigA